MWDLTSFGRSERGNIGMMTALCIGFLVVGAGAAIDFSAVSKRNNDIQNFADAAVLAAAKARTDDEDELREIVKAVIAEHNTENWPLDITFDFSGDAISVDVATNYNAVLMGFIGKDQIPVGVVSKAPRAFLTPINLALVVDTTESMQGANIAALRTAASALVDEMEDMEAETRLSLVPFAQYVNVGTSQGTPGTRNWIDMLNYGDSYQHCWEPTITVTEPTCRVTGTESYDHMMDGRNMGRRTRDKRTCSGGVYDKGPEQCTTRTYGWNGCMGSRTGLNAARADVNGERIPVALDETCGTELTPLTRDYDGLRATIASLETDDSTYLPTGLMWGWRTLTAAEPFTQAATSTDPRTKRAMLFMTDGINIISRGNSRNNASGPKHEFKDDDGAAGLALTETLCRAIAQDGVEIFVVAYKLPEEGRTGEVLERCASTPSHYFEPESAADLVADFREIAGALDYTRLSY